MIEIYKEMFPNRGMNHQILKSSLSDRGLQWDKEIRGKDGIKGCYINVIRKIENINNNEDDNNYKFGKNSPLDNGIYLEPDYKKLYFELLEKQKETPKQVQKTEEITEDDVEALEKELNDACNDFKPKQQKEKPEPEPEPENNFNEDDINDILGFIENTKNNKKSKKSRK